jgi:transposase
VLLIWDGAPSHRGEVKSYLKQLYQQRRTYHKRRWKLQLMYFPPYWPKLNPQERVWKAGKQQTIHNSEDSYEDKLYKFRQFVTNHTFKTNFLIKYASF